MSNVLLLKERKRKTILSYPELPFAITWFSSAHLHLPK